MTVLMFPEEERVTLTTVTPFACPKMTPMEIGVPEVTLNK